MKSLTWKAVEISSGAFSATRLVFARAPGVGLSQQRWGLCSRGGPALARLMDKVKVGKNSVGVQQLPFSVCNVPSAVSFWEEGGGCSRALCLGGAMSRHLASAGCKAEDVPLKRKKKKKRKDRE